MPGFIASSCDGFSAATASAKDFGCCQHPALFCLAQRIVRNDANFAFQFFRQVAQCFGQIVAKAGATFLQIGPNESAHFVAIATTIYCQWRVA
jgi:hypothetical protein